MRDIIDSMRTEYERYKGLAEAALDQLKDEELSIAPGGQSNSAAALVRHIGGNLVSRFTDFLKSDGEKPWRDRESEFLPRAATRVELLGTWAEGWAALFSALDALTDEDLGAEVTIRGQPLSVRDALHRSLSHTASHVGQIVYLAKSLRGGDWRYLSIPPGQSAAYNTNPVLPKPLGRRPNAQEELADLLERSIAGPLWHGPSLAQAWEGITAAEAAAHPVPGAHSIGELVRHMTAWAEFARQRLSGSGGADPSDAEDWPEAGPPGEVTWQADKGRLESSYRSLAAEARGMSDARLAATVAGHSYTVAEMVRGVVEHGAYHGGQIALLRRALRGPAR